MQPGAPGNTHHPLGSPRWAGVGALALGVFAFVTTEFLPVGVLPQIAADLRVSLSTAGLMLTAPGIVAAMSAPATLLLAGAIDRRRLLIVLTGLLLLADLGCAFAPNFLVVVLGRALLGAGLGGFWAVALAAGGRLVPARLIARAVSLIVAGITCATILGLPTGSLIGSVWGWRASFAAAAILAGISILGQAVFLPSLPVAEKLVRSDFLLLLRRGKVRRALALVLCLFGGNLAAYTYLSPYLEAQPGLGSRAVPVVLLVFGITSFLANLVIPGALERHPRAVVAGQAAAIAIGLLGLVLSAGTLPVTLLLLLLWAVPFGAVPLCLNHWVQGASTEAPEAGSALYVSTVQIAIALGSAAGALAVQGLGLPANFGLGAGLALVGCLLLLQG
ncbi:MFS transporter [Sphingobium amiense]|uniref:MFS transporter n=1 Tax=Sphingobium amiense TaxID=135719 RepID=A0A494W1A8_9SPHN|nr:MFS transporter [Sphingobium amiense]